MYDKKWWEPYIPKAGEAYSDYLRRALTFELEFVMMEQKPDDLGIIADGHKLLRTNFVHAPGKYVVFVIRDLVFLAYTKEWADDEW